MKAYKETKTPYYKTVYEQATAGEYEVELSADEYYVELYGAGGGAGGNGWEAAGCLGGGGSGAGFKGMIKIDAPITISIIVGAGGAGNCAYTPNTSRTGKDGGDSSFGSIITCGGGKGGRGYSTATSYGGAGGTLTINDTDGIIKKTETGTDGQANVYARGPYSSWNDCSGGLSVQDGTHYGAGAGGWSQLKGLTSGLNGYCKIMTQTTEDDYEIKEETATYKLPTKLNGQIQQINGKMVGTLTNNDGVISGFSSTSWLVLPNNFSPNSNSWEAVAKFKLNSLDVNQYLFNSSSLAYQPFHVGVNSSNKLDAIGYVNNTSTALFTINGATVLSAGTTYYAKLTYNHQTGYELSLSTDGKSYTSQGKSTVLTPIASGYNLTLGADFGENGAYYAGAFQGSIDLTQCYIKINGELWWQGVTYKDKFIYYGIGD